MWLLPSGTGPASSTYQSPASVKPASKHIVKQLMTFNMICIQQVCFCICGARHFVAHLIQCVCVHVRAGPNGLQQATQDYSH